MRAHDQSSIFSIGGKFRSDYELLLELQALTLVARSYVLLLLWQPKFYCGPMIMLHSIWIPSCDLRFVTFRLGAIQQTMPTSLLCKVAKFNNGTKIWYLWEWATPYVLSTNGWQLSLQIKFSLLCCEWQYISYTVMKLPTYLYWCFPHWYQHTSQWGTGVIDWLEL